MSFLFVTVYFDGSLCVTSLLPLGFPVFPCPGQHMDLAPPPPPPLCREVPFHRRTEPRVCIVLCVLHWWCFPLSCQTHTPVGAPGERGRNERCDYTP